MPTAKSLVNILHVYVRDARRLGAINVRCMLRGLLRDVACVWPTGSQHVTTWSNNVGICCVEILRSFGRGFIFRIRRWSWSLSEGFFFPSDRMFCILFFVNTYIALDYSWISNKNLNRHHPSSWVIPLVGTGQRKKKFIYTVLLVNPPPPPPWAYSFLIVDSFFYENICHIWSQTNVCPETPRNYQEIGGK